VNGSGRWSIRPTRFGRTAAWPRLALESEAGEEVPLAQLGPDLPGIRRADRLGLHRVGRLEDGQGCPEADGGGDSGSERSVRSVVRASEASSRTSARIRPARSTLARLKPAMDSGSESIRRQPRTPPANDRKLKTAR